MPQIWIEAPAKLNLHLQLGEKRSDGFHDIESLFLALAFGDTLCFEPAPAPLEILMDWQTEAPSEFLPEKNIISKAVSLFRDRTGWNEGLKISVTKRIPLGGGLGGGSSDAASTLLGMNRLLAQPLTLAELVEMGVDLGSDVPFFLYNTPSAWVIGRGELVQPFNLPEMVRNLSFVLAGPGFSSDTARAFRLYDLWNSIHIPSQPLDPRLARESLSGLPRDWLFFNDFLPVFLDGTAESTAFSDEGIIYQHIINDLLELGADFAGLSGSGSTCFGVFSRHKEAELARKALLKRYSFVINTFSLAR